MQPYFFKIMKISFADFYYNNLSAKTLSKIKSFLKKQKFPPVSKLDIFLISLENVLKNNFGIAKIDFPYYHYYPNEIYKTEEILIDVSINDNFYWQSNLRNSKKEKDKFKIPQNLKNLLRKYNNLLNKKQIKILFDTGFYRTQNLQTNKIEEYFLTKVDANLVLLNSILLHASDWQERVNAVFFLGYAAKKEKIAIRFLKQALNDKDHAVHNMAARSLFPKIIVKKVDVLDLQKLLNHHNPYCQNKFLGIASNIQLDKEIKKEFQTIKSDIKKRTKYRQKIVSCMAKELIKKI